MARYERIMDKKTIDALMDVRSGLFDLKRSMHVVSDKLEARMLEAEKFQKKASSTQSRMQTVTIALMVVISFATVTYTWITWQSVQAQREANAIQHKALKTKPPVQPPSNTAVESDAPKATRQSF
jgi:uncharacterized membrane protein (DUF106 family)